jgi:hypothetical protein
MNYKKLTEKIEEETIITSHKDEIWEKIKKNKDSSEFILSPRLRIMKTVYLVFTLAVLITISILIYNAIKPKDSGQPLNNNPPVYGEEDLQQTIISYKEIGDFYSKSLDIEGFKTDSVFLYRTSDENKVPIYLNVKYVRINVMDAPWDNDTIFLNIVLYENFQFSNEFNYNDEILNKTLPIAINSKEITIKYYEQGDQGDGTWDGFINAKTKFVFGNYTYYIDTTYYPINENNILESIVTDLIN